MYFAGQILILSSVFYRYALDVHTDRAEDVLTHKRLLHEARIPENRPAFHVRAVQVCFPPPIAGHSVMWVTFVTPGFLHRLRT